MYPRYVARRIRENLTDTRVVLLCGPRQSGKTTLARQIASENFRFVTLDDPTFLNAAQADPVGFVRDFDKAVIDEVQRAPRLMLALKLAVDADPRPGRFLLTGSADLLTIPHLPACHRALQILRLGTSLLKSSWPAAIPRRLRVPVAAAGIGISTTLTQSCNAISGTLPA